MRNGVLTAVFVWLALAAICFAGDDPADVELLEQQAFRSAVDRVAPSVVRIETVGGLQRVGKVLFGSGPTTGLVVGEEGYIVSSAFNFLHRPSSILVRLPDDTLKPAKLVATDHSRMLVLLKIDVEQPLAVPEVAPQDEMRVGQWAIAVGRTFEGDVPNVAVGIVSALGRVWGKAIQTDAAVSPNNYGGPLLDVRGRVLGVLVPLSPHAATEVAGYQWYDSGIGFAVPAEHVMKILPRLREGDLHPGVIGITLGGRNPSIGEPVIDACRPASPADEAGLKSGDRIVEIDATKIVRAAGVKEQLARRYAGDKVRIVVLRGDERIERELELVAKLKAYRYPMLGVLPMRGVEVDPEQPAGIVVRWVYPGGPAAEAGIEPGDELVSLGGKELTTRDEWLRELAEFQPGEEVELEVRRAGKTRTLTLRLAELPEALPPAELPPARAKAAVEDAPEQKKSRVLDALRKALSSWAGARSARDLSRWLDSQLENVPLPPGLAELTPFGGKRLKRGVFRLGVAGLKAKAWAYVPQGYDPAVPHGVVVWLDAPGKFDWTELFARWQAHCDRNDLILVTLEASDPQKWQPAAVMQVQKLLQEITSRYTVDPARVVLGGHQGGGTTAYLAAFRHRDKVRAVAVVDAAAGGSPADNEPLKPLAVYSAVAKESSEARAVKKTVAALREKAVPVTQKDLGKDARQLSDDELAELARWIDMLDRL